MKTTEIVIYVESNDLVSHDITGVYEYMIKWNIPVLNIHYISIVGKKSQPGYPAQKANRAK